MQVATQATALCVCVFACSCMQQQITILETGPPFCSMLDTHTHREASHKEERQHMYPTHLVHVLLVLPQWVRLRRGS